MQMDLTAGDALQIRKKNKNTKKTTDLNFSGQFSHAILLSLYR